jgi:chromosome segregation ATPase
MAEVERTNEENARLKQAMTSRNTTTDRLKQEQDEAVRRHRQAQEELGPLRLELSVVVDDLKTARVCRDAQQRDIDRLMGELKKKSFWPRPI